MGKIYVTSDWHFGHEKDFIFKPRGFNNASEMNDAIVKNYNDIVDVDDDVYVLGDCMLNDNETGIKLIKSLKGKIHIILGNHDSQARMNLYKDCYNVVEMCYATVIRYNGYMFYLSHYPSICGNHDADKPLHRKVINLCGHTHTADKFADWDKGLIYHVEVDAHNCTPVLLDNIIKELEEKK